MSGHEIVWTFDRDSIESLVVCNEPVGADCRLAPLSDSVLCSCEEWAAIERDVNGPFHRSGDEIHRMTDAGECNVALFLNESFCIEESAVGKPNFVVGRTPISPVWQGDYYDWERIDPDADRAHAEHVAEQNADWWSE